MNDHEDIERKMYAEKVAAENDRFRRGAAVMDFRTDGQLVLKPGIVELPIWDRISVLVGVKEYSSFETSLMFAPHDPDCEGVYDFHEMGGFEVSGRQILWEIQYYVKGEARACVNPPLNPSQTYRVLTVMQESEY